MRPYSDIATTLQESLKPALPPIAICIADSVPEGVPAFEGQAPAGCLFWQEAAKGAFATSTPDHELCAIGVHTHHLANPSAPYASELGEVLKVMADLDETLTAFHTLRRKDVEAGRKPTVAESLSRLEN